MSSQVETTGQLRRTNISIGNSHVSGSRGQAGWGTRIPTLWQWEKRGLELFLSKYLMAGTMWASLYTILLNLTSVLRDRTCHYHVTSEKLRLGASNGFLKDTQFANSMTDFHLDLSSGVTPSRFKSLPNCMNLTRSFNFSDLNFLFCKTGLKIVPNSSDCREDAMNLE